MAKPEGSTATGGEDDAGEPALENHPGRPRDPDELDPELISLKRPMLSAGPILSGAIIIFCGYIMVQLYSDLRFSRQDDSPKRIATVGQLADTHADSYVSAALTPDRGFAMRVSPSNTTDGHRVAPVLGSGARVWLMVDSEPWAEKATYGDGYRGRLRPLSDMPFADELRSYVRKRGPVPQSVTAAELRKSLESGATTVTRPSGDQVAVLGSTPVIIPETLRDRARITAFIREDRLPDVATWNQALREAGVLGAEGGPISSDPETLFYEVPEGVEEVRRKLIGAKIFAARVDPVVREHRTSWGAVRATPAGLTVDGATLPWVNLEAAVLEAPREVPNNAVVVVTDENPDAYWYVLPLYVVLALFVALFMWALVRTLMPERSLQRASTEARTAA
jgi:hypothetical protein